MWAVGEKCVAAMKFVISGLYSSGDQASPHFFVQMRPRSPSIFFRGGGGGEGGGGFSTPGGGGASLGQTSILKIIIFVMIFLPFLVYFYYVASLNDTN